MTIKEAIKERHSVRAYKDIVIPDDIRQELSSLVEECNADGDLNISIQYDEPEGFNSGIAHYGGFRNVKNYIVLAGKKSKDFNFRCGYYGEKLVLFAQQLGLNTCWVAMTFNKRMVKRLLEPTDTLCMVIALGYGETPGVPHKGKTYDAVTKAENAPDWFKEGVEAALLAPTAINQQKFLFSYKDGEASLKIKGLGANLDTDLGIVKYHFEAASDHNVKV